MQNKDHERQSFVTLLQNIMIHCLATCQREGDADDLGVENSIASAVHWHGEHPACQGRRNSVRLASAPSIIEPYWASDRWTAASSSSFAFRRLGFTLF